MPPIDASLTTLVLWAVLGYLFGSVPFGVVVTRAMGLGNLRDIGSGNIGATNVLRTGNKQAAALTLLMDAVKGVVAVLLARWLVGEDAAQVAGGMALVGHCFPVWLGFKGGKGVATFIGLLLALAFSVGIAVCATWLIVAAIKRVSSLAALVAAASAPVWMLVLGHSQAYYLTALVATLILWRHRENIARLQAGTEPKIGAK